MDAISFWLLSYYLPGFFANYLLTSIGASSIIYSMYLILDENNIRKFFNPRPVVFGIGLCLTIGMIVALSGGLGTLALLPTSNFYLSMLLSCVGYLNTLTYFSAATGVGLFIAASASAVIGVGIGIFYGVNKAIDAIAQAFPRNPTTNLPTTTKTPQSTPRHNNDKSFTSTTLSVNRYTTSTAGAGSYTSLSQMSYVGGGNFSSWQEEKTHLETLVQYHYLQAARGTSVAASNMWATLPCPDLLRAPADTAPVAEQRQYLADRANHWNMQARRHS